MAEKDTDVLYGWIKALCLHIYLRRAAEEAYNALLNPHEALVFVYRAMEWLVEGRVLLGRHCHGAWGKQERHTRPEEDCEFRDWRSPCIEIRNETTTIPENYGTWVVGLFDIINAARVKIEPCYVSVAGEKGAEMISRAIPHVPFE